MENCLETRSCLKSDASLQAYALTNLFTNVSTKFAVDMLIIAIRRHIPRRYTDNQVDRRDLINSEFNGNQEYVYLKKF